MRTYVEQPTVGLRWDRCRKATAKKDAPIEIRVCYRRRVKIMSTRIRVFPGQWKDGRVYNRPDAMILNRQLDSLVVSVREVLYEMWQEGAVELDAIPSRLAAKRKPVVNFIEFCERRAEIRKYGKKKDTQERFDRFLRFLKEWGGIKSFHDIKEAKIMELDKHLKGKNNMLPKSRWGNYHRFLNAFILDAKKENLVNVNPYDLVHLDRSDGSVDAIEKYLDLDELRKIKNAEMPSERLERVRDLFVFHCYFGSGYADLAKFDRRKIKEIDGGKVYVQDRTKSCKAFTVPLLAPALEILEKYGYKLPLLSNVKYNEYLKEVAHIAGIDKHLTTHWARHTAGTMLLNAGVPIEVVSKVLGHSSIRMTERIYAKLLQATMVAEVAKVEEKLTK